MAVIRVFRNNTPDPDCNSTNLTSLPPKRIRMGTRRKDMGTWLGSEPGIRNSPIPIPTPRALPSPSPSVAYAYYPASPGRAPISPELSSPILSARRFHLPFSPTRATDETRSRSQREHDPLSSSHSSTLENHRHHWESEGAEDAEADEASFVSSAFPTFAPPSNSSTPPNPRESPGYDFTGSLNGSSADYHYYQYKHHHQNLQNQYPVQAKVKTTYSPTTGWQSWPAGDHHGDEGEDDAISWSHIGVDVGSGEPKPPKTETEGHDIDSTLAHDNNIDDSEVEYARTLHEKGAHEFGEILEHQIRTGAGDGSDFQYITRKKLRANANVNSMVISVPVVASSSPFDTASEFLVYHYSFRSFLFGLRR